MWDVWSSSSHFPSRWQQWECSLCSSSGQGFLQTLATDQRPHGHHRHHTIPRPAAAYITLWLVRWPVYKVKKHTLYELVFTITHFHCSKARTNSHFSYSLLKNPLEAAIKGKTGKAHIPMVFADVWRSFATSTLGCVRRHHLHAAQLQTRAVHETSRSFTVPSSPYVESTYWRLCYAMLNRCLRIFGNKTAHRL